MSPMLYCIGGASLAGKSDVATQFLIRYFRERVIPGDERAPYYDGTDSVRRMLWATVDKHAEPALFKMHEDRAA
jgi:2-phosphoglycerate kinase